MVAIQSSFSFDKSKLSEVLSYRGVGSGRGWKVSLQLMHHSLRPAGL